MKQQLKIIQKQKQKLSIKQIPSMEILKLNEQDLEEYIEKSLVDNPFSDVEENKVSSETKDMDFKIIKKRNQDENQSFELEDKNSNDLMEYVFPQLSPLIHDEQDEKVFRIIIESLDSRGYLNESENELAAFLNISKNKLQHYLDILKGCDPKGLGSIDLKDCLLYQLEQKSNTQLAQHIVKDHLEDLGFGYYQKIAVAENTTVDEVKKALQIIQSLKPLTANGFQVNTKTLYIVPDVYIYEEDGNLRIEINTRAQNKLKLNTENYDAYKSNTFDVKSKEFLQKKYHDFKWLQYSINRRQITLQKIIEFLVEYQKEYFYTGNLFALKPIRLSDISKELDIHSSTISRATSNKYFQNKYGTFPLKMLIPRSYEKKGQPLSSVQMIKDEIQEMIKYENPEKPLSDEKIRELLDEEGYVVSRRSITLYRQEEGIPSSRKRKAIKPKERK